MRLQQQYPVLAELLKPFRLSQVKTLVAVLSALLEVGAMRSLAIAQCLSAHLGVQVDSALTRFYRLVANERIENELLSEVLLAALAQKPGDVLIALDWTEWVREKRVLVAAVIVGTRAIPVAAATHRKATFLRSQNAFENDFLLRLKAILSRLGIRVVILADRGFRRAKLIRVLSTELQLGFVIRLIDDVAVLTNGRWSRLRDFHLQPGQACELGVVDLGRDRSNRVPVRVVGIRALGQKQTWWLATSESCSLSHVAAMYDRRMAVEEQFRDVKGSSFGFQMEWTQFDREDHIDRLFLLVGIVVFVLIGIGRLVSQSRPHVRFRHPEKGPRQSYLTVGQSWARWAVLHLNLALSAMIRAVPKPAYRHERFSWAADIVVCPTLLVARGRAAAAKNREVPMQN
jgi:hypothetical protein